MSTGKRSGAVDQAGETEEEGEEMANLGTQDADRNKKTIKFELIQDIS